MRLLSSSQTSYTNIMKKYLIVLVLFISLNSFGQFNSGSIYFTGMTGADLGIELQEFNSSIPYNLNLEGGYFIRNRFSVGGNIHSHGYFGLGGSSGTHELFIGPAVRYYMPREDDLQIYYIANPFYAIATGADRLGFMAGAGVNYFLTERIALEARFSYRFLRYVDEFFSYNAHRIGFEAGLSIFFPSWTFFEDMWGSGRSKSNKNEGEGWSPN